MQQATLVTESEKLQSGQKNSMAGQYTFGTNDVGSYHSVFI